MPTPRAARIAGDVGAIRAATRDDQGSLGSKMKLIVTALERRFPQVDAGNDGEGAGHGADGIGRANAVLASDLAQVHTVFNVFRYITFRAGGAVFTACCSSSCSVLDHRQSALRQGKGSRSARTARNRTS